ncbi:MAG TPA: DUF1802 family protein [Dehalococcoidia bacterium]|nr:DUF1802 family protein [Dehalococcoidia bacterium]
MPSTASARVLKEWGVAVEALGQGHQIAIVRKGGIHEKDFDVDRDGFWLYPTREHQRADLLQPPYRADLDAWLARPHNPGLVDIAYWARATDVFEIFEAEAVERLTAHYIWTNDYAQERLSWRPKRLLRIALLRVFARSEPARVPVRPEYGGCKSWIDLAEPVDLGDLRPVLTDAEYEAKARPVRDLLAVPAWRG